MFLRQRENTAIMDETLSTRSVPICYKQLQLVREYLGFCHCELLLLEAGSWGRGQFGNPEEGEYHPLKADTKQRQWRCDCDQSHWMVVKILYTCYCSLWGFVIEMTYCDTRGMRQNIFRSQIWVVLWIAKRTSSLPYAFEELKRFRRVRQLFVSSVHFVLAFL
jgi:hypothetical protein